MATRPRLVLASASPRRAALLAQAGIIPDAIVTPDVDETSKQDEYRLVESLVNANPENIIDNQNQNPTSINQNLSYFKVLGNEDVISLEMQYLYQEENPFLNFLRSSIFSSYEISL